ncbi:MAG TPA: (2Fe-2S)-binding protein [Acidimicrobiales bacterium]|nr:(2Fe-2S)-binding protein [Acidimicrobiales bacterium]
MPSYRFVVNKQPVTVNVPGDMRVLWVLRDVLGLTGTKYGCGMDECRACTCHVDGRAFATCSTPVSEVAGHEITTIEGLADGDRLHPVQQAWLDQDVPQCGYCQPGQIMTAAALLRVVKHPSDAEIDQIKNICRCGTYFRIREAIKAASTKMHGAG